MKVKIIVGAVLLVIVLSFVMSKKNDVSVVQEEVQLKTRESQDQSLIQEDSIEETALELKDTDSVSQVEGDKFSPLEKLHKKVDGLSMFNQNGLDELREQAYAWMEKNPKEFENYTLEQVKDADKKSIESLFFFVEAYAKKHPNPADGINEILKMESTKENKEAGHVEMNGQQKQNMTKAFALEAYFNRLEKNSSGPPEGIAKIEETVRELVEKDNDLMMVRQGLQVLRNNLDYDQEQLKEIIESRPNSANEGHAVSDILAE